MSRHFDSDFAGEAPSFPVDDSGSEFSAARRFGPPSETDLIRPIGAFGCWAKLGLPRFVLADAGGACFVSVACFADQVLQHEDLGALAPRDAQGVQNSDPLADALHLGLQAGELCP